MPIYLKESVGSYKHLNTYYAIKDYHLYPTNNTIVSVINNYANSLINA